ncbi:MAG: DUF1326 domain-containing protein [Planctomycetaceae bacterium]|nr:DUF1326 domain-containing protein [Planctomycetaceae bacterium]
MRFGLFAALITVWSLVSSANAATIEGEYLEARTCNVYTGPCFANGEMGMAGKEAIMAWKVDKGTWNDTKLDGLGVALVVTADDTLGDDGVFGQSPVKTKSVVLIDKNADKTQKEALISFVKDSAKKLANNIVRVEEVPFTLNNDHVDAKGTFTAGEIAKIETRKLRKGDCVCTNEIVYYQPLTKVQNFHPAYSLSHQFQGKGLNNRWSSGDQRSAFLATFRR